MSTDDHPTSGNRLRKRVHERDEYRCQNCERRGGPHGEAELHARHVVPRSRGGSHHPRNLQTLCRQCHVRIPDHRILGSGDRIRRRLTRTSTESPSESGGDVVQVLLVGGVLSSLLVPLLIVAL